MKELTTNSVTKSSDSEIVTSTETVTSGQESSVEIADLAKGEKKITVKVYHADPFEAAKQALQIYNEMKQPTS